MADDEPRSWAADKWAGYVRDVVIVSVAIFLLVTQTFRDHPDQYIIGAAVTLLIGPAYLRARKGD